MPDSVFHDYDQEALDWEYNNRGKVPDTEACKAAQLVGSDAAKAAYDCRLDVRFGPGDTDFLDIYQGAGAGPGPVHLFFHGGYWKSNTKDDFGFVAKLLVPYGITTIVVDYPLIPSVRMATLIDRCRASIAWVWNQAEDIDIDRDRITISGHSAGGHITQMMLATDWAAYGEGLPGDLIKGGCSISGVSDLEPVRLCFQNDELQLTPQEVAEFSTLAMDPKHPGPLLAVAGSEEGPEFIRQTEAVAAAWSAKGMATERWIMPGKHHFTTINELLDAESALSRRVRAQTGVTS
jgi:arylformamidase